MSEQVMMSEQEHRKRMANILVYIANMHQSLSNSNNSDLEGFVRTTDHTKFSDFFQKEDANHKGNYRILATTRDFKKLWALDQSPDAIKPSPFTFYAAAASGAAQGNKTSISNALTWSSSQQQQGRACWLRVTRLAHIQASSKASTDYRDLPRAVQTYLADWFHKTSSSYRNVQDFYSSLTLKHLERAPKPAPTQSGHRRIQRFLQRHRAALVRTRCQLLLEPIYNELFEWIQENNDQELLWGLGHARMIVENDGNKTVINGPLLEIHMEVELAHDGALILRPREYSGVTLNRQVLAALPLSTSITQIQQSIAELEPCSLSPGQPNTYISILKRIAIELTSGGRFELSSKLNAKSQDDFSNLIVTEAWCLYSRSKPSSVWARDALSFAEALQRPESNCFLPTATWSLTCGPAELERVQQLQSLELLANNKKVNPINWIRKKVFGSAALADNEDSHGHVIRHLFPFPASAMQERVAELLLKENFPAVVCEGPPGSGKSHCIVNLICAYLCQGKRVLVTSKNAPALSVLRQRLPLNVQELCVDVSSSEQSGMRQLQQTVERLADRICSVSCAVESEKCRYIERDISVLEKELAEIDKQLVDHIGNSQRIFQSQQGQKLTEIMLDLLDLAPWIARQFSQWTVRDATKLRDRVASLMELSQGEVCKRVTGYNIPVSDALVSAAAAKAGYAISVVEMSTKGALASLPVIGSVSGLTRHISEIEDMLSSLRVDGSSPTMESEWTTVLKALRFIQAVFLFDQEVWKPMQRTGEWPARDFCRNLGELEELHRILIIAAEAKELEYQQQISVQVAASKEALLLDSRRGAIVSRIQALASELVNCKVVAELSQSFSVDAQSALIRFAQLAGKTKFSRASQPSKMTQRQRRRRQEYLDAFSKCCKFIPCWILTSSQISDYLPAECMFDLIVCDESSQSDVVSILPGMLRGKQWLIVGDTKQVSPTDCFVSEEQIESLQASLPHAPFASSFLPGQSFFDLCAQAFPRGRVVLSEHFRCAEEIIAFSNEQFYDERLVPLRLPKKSERLDPVLVDIKIQGTKVGKVNAAEANEIVSRVEEMVSGDTAERNPRSIGIISLIGDEQSRLIRGRLLDTIGPQKMARHSILVGDPPTFQGAERDIIILSMVASPGSVPTQSQLMHFQRANVALSRARDQCVLLRSIGIGDIASADDIKILIIKFFQTDRSTAESSREESAAVRDSCRVQCLLRETLLSHGFLVRGMGRVWKNGICVEQQAGDNRAALLVEGAGESQEQWLASFAQQKAIERVGWKGMRIDALSLLVDFDGTVKSILDFLERSGIHEPKILYDQLENSEDEKNDVDSNEVEEEMGLVEDAEVAGRVEQGDHDIVVISSNDEDSSENLSQIDDHPDVVPSGPLEDTHNDSVAPSNFGQIVDLSFLKEDGGDEDSDSSDDLRVIYKRKRPKERDEYAADDSDSSAEESSGFGPQKLGKKRRRRLQKYEKDGRWYLSHSGKGEDDPDGLTEDWYDTDSDVSGQQRKSSAKDR